MTIMNDLVFQSATELAAAIRLRKVSSTQGLPIGVQVVGRRWGDGALLNAAEALTALRGSFRRPPGF